MHKKHTYRDKFNGDERKFRNDLKNLSHFHKFFAAHEFCIDEKISISHDDDDDVDAVSE